MKVTSLFLAGAWLTLVASACTPAAQPPAVALTGPRAWIDAPLDGSSIPLAPLEVVSHASDPAHIARVELSVNGSVVRTDDNVDAAKTLTTTKQQWTPPNPGKYTLSIRAQNGAGAWGELAQVVINVGALPGGVVQGVVYSDLNADGKADTPEQRLDGVVVTLSGCASRTTTTRGGQFQFSGLAAGGCLVAVSKPGWTFSGTFPAGIGYPVRAASDPAKPTTLSIFMMPLPTPTPTPTAAVTDTPSPLPAAGIAFYADQLNLVSGQCTTLYWQATNVSQVALGGQTVSPSGSRGICPVQTISYRLHVVTLDGQIVERQVTIAVSPGTATPAKGPTRVPGGQKQIPTWTPTLAPAAPPGPPVRRVTPTFTPTSRPALPRLPFVPRLPSVPTRTPTPTRIYLR